MPQGTCTIRLQNSLQVDLLRHDFAANNAVWNQNPPAVVGADSTSGNFQLSFNFPDGGQADFHMRYAIPETEPPFTAAAIIETNPQTGVVTVTPSGAGPGTHTVTWNVLGQYPAFQLLFTFN